jgi:hypothetical protein
MNIKELANKVFSTLPQEENSINVEFEFIEKTEELFETFLELFTEGMKILYGENDQVDLSVLSIKEFKKVEKYFKSMRIKLYYHIFHIQQIEELENQNNKSDFQVKYDTELTLTNEQLCANFPESPTKDMLIKYKLITSNNIIDYKFQLKVKDILYVIYFEL